VTVSYKAKTTLQTARDAARNGGRALRASVPRSGHATWSASQRKGHPLEMLIASGKSRLEHLLPLRYGRMSHTPFTYMRGAAAMMAADVATGPVTNILVQACGDCHLGNFGAFASPERRVLFDLNDFDETLPASWEFDLKRLVVSFVLLARQQGCTEATAQDVTATALAAYRKHLHTYVMQSPLDNWYASIDTEILIRTAPDEATRKRRIDFEKKARKRTAESLMGKMLEAQDGHMRFLHQPPVLAHLAPGSELERSFRLALERYPATLSEERRYLLSRYRLEDIALKVVGVGSVGTRCGVALYVSDGGDRLVLQVKEANASVLAPYVGNGPHSHQGERVVFGQRLAQCASDIFLGWASDDNGHQYYVRQLRDMKTSVAYEQMTGQVMFNFADMCGWALARSHAKSGDGARLSGYIGKSEQFDVALIDYEHLYADQCEADFAIFQKAIRTGKIPVELETTPD